MLKTHTLAAIDLVSRPVPTTIDIKDKRQAGVHRSRADLAVDGFHLRSSRSVVALCAALAGVAWIYPAAAEPVLTWTTVVNNGVAAPDPTKPTSAQLFNSYSGSSVNNDALVVFRGRTQGGETGRVSGVFSRDMSVPAAPVQAIAVVGGTVPEPNNLAATFTEFPSLPRIDAGSSLIATRGQTKPVLEYATGTDPATGLPITTKVGTTGLYTTFGDVLSTGEQKLGMVPDPFFSKFQVPQPAVGADQLPFEQFPGAPAAFDGQFIAFKGNYTDENKVGQTGVFYRDVSGTALAVPIAYRGQALPNQPDNDPSTPPVVFGSTSPPSAAKGKVVFTGLDNEEAPTAGGIYMGKVGTDRSLTTLVAIGDTVPGATFGDGNTLNRIGEGLSFDGRYLSFWGAWGSETHTVTKTCPADGNPAVIAYCIDKDDNGTPKDGIYEFEVSDHQGIFQKDIVTGALKLVAQTGPEYEDFLFWNFSGNAGQDGNVVTEEEEGARWRSTAFLASDGQKVVFKAQETDNVFGLYLDRDVSDANDPYALLTSEMFGEVLDSAATGLSITALGIERDSFRNGWLVINASMEGTINGVDLGWAGVYLTQVVPEPSSVALVLLALGILVGSKRRQTRQTGEFSL